MCIQREAYGQPLLRAEDQSTWIGEAIQDFEG